MTATSTRVSGLEVRENDASASVRKEIQDASNTVMRRVEALASSVADMRVQCDIALKCVDGINKRLSESINQQSEILEHIQQAIAIANNLSEKRTACGVDASKQT